MIISPLPIDLNLYRITRPVFASNVLTNNAQTDIYWHDSNDHANPFPWRFDLVDNPSTMVYYTETQLVTPVYNGNAQYHRSYTYVTGDPALTESFEMWFVDKDGVDLFDMFDGGGGARAEKANGFYFKQTAAHQTITRTLDDVTIVWRFADRDGVPIPPPI